MRLDSHGGHYEVVSEMEYSLRNIHSYHLIEGDWVFQYPVLHLKSSDFPESTWAIIFLVVSSSGVAKVPQTI